MPNGDNIGVKKYFCDVTNVTNLYDVTIRRFMYISYTLFLEDGVCLVRESLTRIYEKSFKMF